MNTNCIAHYLPEYKTGSMAMMMADVAELIPEFRHVCLEADDVKTTDPDLNMYLLSRGIVTHYGGEPLKDAVVELFYNSSGIEIAAHGHSFSLAMRNVPQYNSYSKIRNKDKIHVKFHIGVLFGDSHVDSRFLADMALMQPENSTLFVTTKEGRSLPENYAELFKEEKAFSCPFIPGMLTKYLGWLDVAVMHKDSISDRLKLELESAGVPVIIGTIDTILTQLNDIRTNRELYKQTRNHALLNAAGNDMAYEIIKLKTHIGRAMSWSITNSSSERKFLATLTQQAESI